METIILKINTKSKKGLAFLEFIKQFMSNDKSIEIVKMPNEETLKSMANVEAGIGLTKTKNHADLMKKLNS